MTQENRLLIALADKVSELLYAKGKNDACYNELTQSIEKTMQWWEDYDDLSLYEFTKRDLVDFCNEVDATHEEKVQLYETTQFKNLKQKDYEIINLVDAHYVIDTEKARKLITEAMENYLKELSKMSGNKQQIEACCLKDFKLGDLLQDLTDTL